MGPSDPSQLVAPGTHTLPSHGLPPPPPSQAGLPHVPAEAIDPALVPLPPAVPGELANFSGHAPAEKVAGSHRSAKDLKGKGRADDVGCRSKRGHKRKVSTLPDDEPVRKRGRAAGVANYRDDEVSALLDLAEDELPICGKGWQVVGRRHRQWAKTCGRPERSDQSLESKYKQVSMICFI